MSNSLETRCFRVSEEWRIVETEGQETRVEGLAAPYGALSEDLGGFRERLVSGAFSEAVRAIQAGEQDFRVDIEHDQRQLLARTSKNTASIREDNRGLWVSFALPGTTTGRDALEDIRNGNRDGMSVSWLYEGTEDRFLEENGETVREVLKAPVVGVTLTAYPAYRQTVDTLVLRSLEHWREEQKPDGKEQKPSIANLRRRLELEASDPCKPLDKRIGDAVSSE